MSEFLSDMSADATAVGLDMPGGGYDRLHTFLERRVNLPKGKAGRTAVVALMLSASRLVKQQLGTMGPIANFLNEIGEDAVREEAKRILETAGRATASRQVNASPTGTDAMLEMDETARGQLLEQYRQLDTAGQHQMREQMLRTTATELAILAGMSRDNLATLLTVLVPREPKRPGMLDRFATELFPWLKEK